MHSGSRRLEERQTSKENVDRAAIASSTGTAMKSLPGKCLVGARSAENEIKSTVEATALLEFCRCLDEVIGDLGAEKRECVDGREKVPVCPRFVSPALVRRVRRGSSKCGCPFEELVLYATHVFYQKEEERLRLNGDRDVGVAYLLQN